MIKDMLGLDHPEVEIKHVISQFEVKLARTTNLQERAALLMAINHRKRLLLVEKQKKRDT